MSTSRNDSERRSFAFFLSTILELGLVVRPTLPYYDDHEILVLKFGVLDVRFFQFPSEVATFLSSPFPCYPVVRGIEGLLLHVAEERMASVAEGHQRATKNGGTCSCETSGLLFVVILVKVPY